MQNLNGTFQTGVDIFLLASSQRYRGLLNFSSQPFSTTCDLRSRRPPFHVKLAIYGGDSDQATGTWTQYCTSRYTAKVRWGIFIRWNAGCRAPVELSMEESVQSSWTDLGAVVPTEFFFVPPTTSAHSGTIPGSERMSVKLWMGALALALKWFHSSHWAESVTICIAPLGNPGLLVQFPYEQLLGP